jgi:hypothetical protein
MADRMCVCTHPKARHHKVNGVLKCAVDGCACGPGCIHEGFVSDDGTVLPDVVIGQLHWVWSDGVRFRCQCATPEDHGTKIAYSDAMQAAGCHGMNEIMAERARTSKRTSDTMVRSYIPSCLNCNERSITVSDDGLCDECDDVRRGGEG